MPYNTYTNDSDVQFSKQLDSFKLGIGSKYGHSDYAATEAALDMLPMEMNVARLLQARAGLHGASMATRKAVSDDTAFAQESDDYNSFSNYMQENIVPGDYEHNAKVKEQAALYWGDSDRAMKAMDSLSKAESGRLTARSFRAQDRAHDEDDATWDDRVELSRLEVSNKMLQMKTLKNELELNQSASDAEVFNMAAKFAGSVFSQDKEMGDSAIEAIYFLEKENDFGAARTLNGVLGKLSRGSLIEQVYAEEAQAAAQLINEIEREFKIDLNKATSPEEYVAMVKEVSVRRGKVDPAVKEKNQQQLAMHSKVMMAAFARAALQQKVSEHLASRPDNLQSLEGDKWKAGLRQVERRASLLDGEVSRQEQQVGFRLAEREKAQAMQKFVLDIKDKAQSIKLDAESHDMKMILNQIEIQKIPRAEAIRLIGMAVGKAKRPEEIEKWYDQIKTMAPQGVPGEGTSVF